KKIIHQRGKTEKYERPDVCSQVYTHDDIDSPIYSQAMNSISKSPASGDLTSKTDAMAIIEHQRSEDYDPAILFVKQKAQIQIWLFEQK
ncbi:unnamed protein product, partial [Brassica oleracea var. botrytis]